MSDYFVYESDYPEEGTIITAESNQAAIEQYKADAGSDEAYPDDYAIAVEVDYCHQCHRLKESAAPIQEEDRKYCTCSTSPAPAFYPGEMFPVFAEIMAERAHQDERWGGAEHDSQHTRYDFAEYIGTYLDKLTDGPLEEARHRMVQVAALACAALQHCPDLQPTTTPAPDVQHG